MSVVMLLASGNQPTEFQMKTATAYLECIKDYDGNTPPNIQGLLNHINMVTDETYSDAQENHEEDSKHCGKIDEEDEEEEEEEQDKGK